MHVLYGDRNKYGIIKLLQYYTENRTLREALHCLYNKSDNGESVKQCDNG